VVVRETATDLIGSVVPMVATIDSWLLGAGSRLGQPLPLKHSGQRWHALAVQDYESRALPLSYGGDGSIRYSIMQPIPREQRYATW